MEKDKMLFITSKLHTFFQAVWSFLTFLLFYSMIFVSIRFNFGTIIIVISNWDVIIQKLLLADLKKKKLKN